jgi:hypothetical protein
MGTNALAYVRLVAESNYEKRHQYKARGFFLMEYHTLKNGISHFEKWNITL